MRDYLSDRIFINATRKLNYPKKGFIVELNNLADEKFKQKQKSRKAQISQSGFSISQIRKPTPVDLNQETVYCESEEDVNLFRLMFEEEIFAIQEIF